MWLAGAASAPGGKFPPVPCILTPQPAVGPAGPQNRALPSVAARSHVGGPESLVSQGAECPLSPGPMGLCPHGPALCVLRSPLVPPREKPAWPAGGGLQGSRAVAPAWRLPLSPVDMGQCGGGVTSILQGARGPAWPRGGGACGQEVCARERGGRGRGVSLGRQRQDRGPLGRRVRGEVGKGPGSR